MKTTRTAKLWDYTEHAKYYSLRPNYAPTAIDALVEYVGAKRSASERFINKRKIFGAVNNLQKEICTARS